MYSPILEDLAEIADRSSSYGRSSDLLRSPVTAVRGQSVFAREVLVLGGHEPGIQTGPGEQPRIRRWRARPSAEAAVNAAKADRILAAADCFGWGQPQPTRPPDYRRVAAIGSPRPRIMTLIDDLLSTANTPGFGSQQYRALSAIAHAAPHATGLVGDESELLTAHDIAQQHLPMLGAFGLAALMLCDRMGWDNRVVRVVYDKTLRLWLEAAEPGSSTGLIEVF